MSSVVISGDTSGAITVAAPAVAGTYTQTLPMITGTLGTLNSGTINGGAASPLASGTTVDFTSIPANVRRITIMFNEVSQNSATQTMIVQIGSTTFTTSGYKSGICYAGAGTLTGANPTAGFGVASQLSNSAMMSGIMTITTLGSNIWVASFAGGTSDAAYAYIGGGSLTLGGTLDRVRVTTVGGTATFDAGNINILYE